MKRGRVDEERSGFGGASKGRVILSEVVREAMKEDLVDRIVVKMEPIMERVVERVVREQLKCVVQTLQSRSLYGQIETSGAQGHDRIEAPGAQGLQLRFESKPQPTIFTGNQVETENGSLLNVVLIDANSNNIVSSGPMSNSRIEIVAIDGDFGSDDREDWSEKEFMDNILRERKGKRPLLVAGDQNVTLRHGVCNITDVSFTDNSCWTRSRKFKLGVRVVRRDPSDVRIREALSEAFVVKDHRGEYHKKKHPPHLSDDVWRLKKIGKDGVFHKRLAANEAGNLMEFLRKYHIDSSRLRNILGGNISDKTWHTIIEHAKDCVVDDDKLHVYCGESAWVVFDSIYKPVGVTFAGQNYSSLDALDSSQLRLVQDLKQQAYKNVTDFVDIDKSSVSDLIMPFPSQQATPNLAMSTRLNNFEGSMSRVISDHSMTPISWPPPPNVATWGQGNDPGIEVNPMTLMFSTPPQNVVPWGQGYEPGIERLPSISGMEVHITRTRSKAWYKIRAIVHLISFKQSAIQHQSSEFDWEALLMQN